MRRTLALIRSKYGGAEGYLSSKCNIPPSELETIQQSLLIPSSQSYPRPFERH